MKEKEINKEYEKQQQIIYVEKDDGSYGPVQAGSYLTNNFLDDFWFKKKNLEKQLTEKVSDNQMSTISYFMILGELSESELASRAGVSKRILKKHLQAKNFSGIRVSVLERYAQVFGIPVADLFQQIQYEEQDGMKSFYIKDKISENIDIQRVRTKNPLFVITQIKKKI